MRSSSVSWSTKSCNCDTCGSAAGVGLAEASSPGAGLSGAGWSFCFSVRVMPGPVRAAGVLETRRQGRFTRCRRDISTDLGGFQQKTRAVGDGLKLLVGRKLRCGGD